jgi:acetyltransferase
MIVLVTPPLYTAAGVVNAFLPVVHTASKPVVVAIMGERLIQEAVERLRAAHVPDYRFPERAASALAALWRRARMQVDDSLPPRPPGTGPHPARDRVEDLLADYGIPVARTERVRDAEAAADAAVALGFPVVLKAEADGLVHKTDVGGVVTGLTSPDGVRDAYASLERSLARHGLRMTGASLQVQADAVSEVIVGAVRDPQFGPLLMFGSGGVEVEAHRDVAFALAPLARGDVDHLLAETWAGRALAGYRGTPAGDREAVADVLVRMAHLVADHPGFEELEINPLLVGPAGGGVLAVDVRGRWSPDVDAPVS